jgi:hypothetical protein
MRLASAALALTLLSAAAASAQPLGSPAPPTPYDVDRFNGPNLGETPVGSGLPPQRTAMERLRSVCNSSLLRDRSTCRQAWREINAAYAQLQAERRAEGKAPD